MSGRQQRATGGERGGVAPLPLARASVVLDTLARDRGLEAGGMSVEQMRTRLAGAAEWITARPFGHVSWTCDGCNRLHTQIDSWALAHDLAVSVRHRRAEERAG